MSEDFTITIDGLTCSHSDVLEQLQDLKKERYEEQSGGDFEGELEDDFTVTDWEDVPEWAQYFDVLEELIPALENSSYEIEIFEAAHECSIGFNNVDEAYSGEYKSNEDFAQDIAEQLGLLDESKGWPYTCIDWEYAAKELMYDYSESSGYYFRNL
jgi:antirestriction protein